MNKKIVIASVLKPVDDVRAFWKIAQSLAKTNKYEVNIIGNAGKKASGHKKIHFHPHRVRRNQLLWRISIRYKALQQILRIKPDILIVSTHELLTIAALTRLLLPCRVIYDVQENYQLNATMRGLGGRLAGILIRFKEVLSTLYVQHYWLAEECYVSELRFARKATIVSNKAIHFRIAERTHDNIRALFSGTTSDYSGRQEIF